MSKLSDAITATFTGETVHTMQFVDIETNSISMPSYSSYPTSYVYNVEARFGMSKVVDKPSHLTECQKDIRRAVIEEVFGEFRPYLYNMRAALYDRDDGKVRRLLNELEERMFDV
jgi:hypothetical protein